MSSPEDIVISGISGSFPDSANVKEFGENLNAKKVLISNDSRRWTLSHPEICNHTGKLPILHKFDGGYFGVHYRQATTMDPMIRIFLEKSIEAILDAGVNPRELEGTKTGVFVGICASETEQTWFLKKLQPRMFAVTGCLRSFVSHRLSFHLKLKGPSHTTDTACSSSLYALEHAVRAIKNGECDKAIVGGCNLCLHPYVSLQFSRLGVLNKDGKCKTFDDSADGYTRSETIAAVFLQKAADAKRVYCEVVHVKTNCDGYKEQGITFPSTEAQKTLMEDFYQECGVNPLEISYLEAHGTGTLVGDPEELDAISKIFVEGRDRPLMIGSVKSNIGHTEPASGVASITKAILATESGLIPPNLNYKTPRKEVKGLSDGMLIVVTEPTPFEDDRGLIGVNSFGFGGGNCHTLLRWNPKTKINGGKPKDDSPRLICVSGRNEEAINCILDDIKSRPLDVEYLGLLHEIFKINLSEHNYRGFSIISKSREVTRSVRFTDGSKPTMKHLVFSDFGPQFIDIINYLKNFEVFKKSFKNIEEAASKAGILNQRLEINELLGSMVLQLAIIDTLKGLNLSFDKVFSNNPTDEIACHYYKGSLTLAECFSIFSKNNKNLTHIHHIDNNTLPLINVDSVIIEVGDKLIHQANHQQIISFGNVHTFLESLGRLYELGQNPTISKLYPRVEFPVSRGTPMISHLIKWEHNTDWFVSLYKSETSLKSGESTFRITTSMDTHRFLQGHVIDGRNLFPATGYLFLVWEVFSEARGMMMDDVPIIFENCKFKRALPLSASTLVDIHVSIQTGSGEFEITVDENALVTGRVRTPRNDSELEFIDLVPEENNQDQVHLKTKDIYKELRLRGYNYKGDFRRVLECNSQLTKGKIAWDNNWITFMDNMLQLKILQEDTRLLYVPTGIKQMIVNPKTLLGYVNSLGENPEVPIHINPKNDTIRSIGIQIRCLGASSITKRKQQAEPLIEKYQFVPNITKLSLEESAKVNTQIILENLPSLKVKVVELVDEATGSHSKLLSPLIHDVLTNLPLIQPDCTIITSDKDLEVENVNVTVSDKGLALLENDCTLVVVSDGLQRPHILRQAFRALKSQAFVISREKLDGPLYDDNSKIDLITLHITDSERLFLIRERVKFEAPKVIDVTAENYSWVSDLQTSLKTDKSILVVAQNSDSGVLGLVNCLRREQSGDKIRCVFIQDDAPRFDYTHPFYFDQVKMGLVANVFKHEEWGSYRHLDLDDPVEVEREHCYLAALDRGNLSSLRWLEGPLKASDRIEGNNQELVHVYYASLNFRDIMSASGRINVDVLVRDRRLQDIIQGIEFSGRTSDGRRVIGLVIGGALSTLVAGDCDFFVEVPVDWSMKEAATVPAVYCTVIYALLVVTTIKRDDRILIHSGTGGIGLSAITLALHYGCEVFTTVSSQEKRDFLKKRFPQLEDDHIGNSRDISFEEMVKTQTNSRGVDFVLNSLVEEKLEASVRCLARGGQFLEIGKFDIGNNKALQLLLLSKEASFHGIMLDNIVLGGADRKRRIVDLLEENIANGGVRPLPITIFKEDQSEEAFRYMTTGKHIGKVLLEIRPEESNIPRNQRIAPSHKVGKALPRYWCNSSKTYVIVGGLGGFGMELADWLVLRGARKLILTSRRGISTGYHTYRINLWKSYGVQVEVVTEDVTSKSGCETILRNASNLGPIDAIFNLAVVLKDAIFENQTLASFAESAKPKADATRHLDELSRRLCPNLRSFVVFSSVSCGRGNSGQTNYGMSNSVMERICEKRRSEGLPGLAIQWGAIGDVGLVADMQEEHVEIEIGGTLQQRIVNCLEVLDRLLNQPNAIVSSMVVSENRSYSGDNALDAVANIIGIKDLKTVSHHATLSELGMDSMSGVEIKQMLERDFDIVLTPQDLRSMTLAKLDEIQQNKTSSESTGQVQSKRINVSDVIGKLTNDEDTARLPYINFKTKALDNEERRVIFIPGIEGVGKVLEPLAANLKYRASCIHFDLDHPPITIKDLAQSLFPTIKKLTVGSDFRIIGYSFGATLALEIVSMLEEEGYSGTLVCLDGSPLINTKTIRMVLDFTSEAHLQTALMVYLTDTYLKKDFDLKDQMKLFQCKSFEERLELGAALVGENASQSFSDAYMRKVCLSSYQRCKSIGEYQPKYAKIKSKVKFYKPGDLIDVSMPDDYGLGELCENLTAEGSFQGNHSTFLGNFELAERINDDFEFGRNSLKPVRTSTDQFVQEQHKEKLI